eukprot:Selendium_serpulae@DN5110_c0_g1_i3.p1
MSADPPLLNQVSLHQIFCSGIRDFTRNRGHSVREEHGLELSLDGGRGVASFDIGRQRGGGLAAEAPLIVLLAQVKEYISPISREKEYLNTLITTSCQMVHCKE